MSSYIQILGKRKIDQTDLEHEPIETMPIIGIVTTRRSWIFIRHTYEAGSRRLEVSSELNDINEVVSYILQLLQAQVTELEQRKPKRPRRHVPVLVIRK